MPPKFAILVRHGESEHHVLKLTGGWTDTPLTGLGHQQAHLVAARLASELEGLPVAVYSSDLIRASQTAGHIARALGVEVRSAPSLREFNNGDAAGLTIAEARERFANTWDLSIFGSDTPVFPNAETGAAFLGRSREFLDSLPESGEVPVLVSHGGTILALVASWLALDPALVHFDIHPTSITTLSDRWVRAVERLNDAGHLLQTEGYVPLSEAARRDQ